MTDWYTDELFELPLELATPVVFPVSRLVVDPERFVDDAAEPMARHGMGVIYARTSRGRPLREPPTPEARHELLARFYHPHHARLTAQVDAALAAHGRCLIIDAHSFGSVPLPHQPDQRPDRPEICIGTDAFHTPTWLRDRAVDAFAAAGFRVEIDRPFSGTIVPVKHYRRTPRVWSVMVEVNRAMYMDEARGSKSERFGKMREKIATALSDLRGTPREDDPDFLSHGAEGRRCRESWCRDCGGNSGAG